MALPALQRKITLEEVKVDPGDGLSISAGPVAGGVGVGVDVGLGVGVALGEGVGVGAGEGVGVGVPVGASVAIRFAPLGVPQPVQRS